MFDINNYYVLSYKSLLPFLKITLCILASKKAVYLPAAGRLETREICGLVFLSFSKRTKFDIDAEKTSS